MGFECYRIGDLLLDAGTQEVTRDGVAVPVPRLSFKLLLSLTRNAPNVVSTEQLEEEVWSGLVVDKGTINKRVLLLRKALGEDKGNGPYVTVIRGSGYRMDIPVTRVGEEPEKPESGVSYYRSVFQRTYRIVRMVAVALLGIVAIIVLFRDFQDAPDRPADTEAGRVLPDGGGQAVVYDQRAIAVLPFVDLSDSNDHQFLGDGIAEEVINLLADMESLNVAARTSSFSFRDSPMTALEIAGELKVGTILEGSVRHEGRQVRVTAQLIDTSNGYHIWSQTYDRSFDQLFSVQDDIAIQISQALKLTLDESEKPDSGKGTTSNIEAFTLYLKGRELLNNRIELRTVGLEQALDYFWKAVELDTNFARAHAGAAAVYWLLPSYDLSLDREAFWGLAESSAHYAIEVDPDSADAMAVLASIHGERGEIEQAVSLFNTILKIGTNNSNIIHWKAMLYMRLGFFHHLTKELEETYARDPLNEHIGWSLAAALNFSGHPEEAEEILAGLEYYTYRDYNLGLTAIYMGDYERARELLRNAQLRSGVLPVFYADLVIDSLAGTLEDGACASQLVTDANEGKLDRLVAFEALLILGSPFAFDLDIDPLDIKRKQILSQVWNNWGVELRQDQRFKDWAEQLGYVDFWRKVRWPDRCRPISLTDFACN